MLLSQYKLLDYVQLNLSADKMNSVVDISEVFFVSKSNIVTKQQNICYC